MVTAPPLWLTRIHTFVERCPRVIRRSRRPARPVISQASTVTSLQTRSRPRELATFLIPSFRLFASTDGRCSFLDLYLSTVKGPASFFGNRSIVIHSSNTTRLTCANFTLTSGNSSGGGNGTSSAGNGTVAGSKPVPFTGGATASFVSAGAILAGLVAYML